MEVDRFSARLPRRPLSGFQIFELQDSDFFSTFQAQQHIHCVSQPYNITLATNQFSLLFLLSIMPHLAFRLWCKKHGCECTIDDRCSSCQAEAGASAASPPRRSGREVVPASAMRYSDECPHTVTFLEQFVFGKEIGAKEYVKTMSGEYQLITVPNVILVFPYPFEQGFLKSACKGLHELGGEVLFPLERTARTHYLTIRQDEMKRLESGELMNDTLIDFAMKWISRNEAPETSMVHFFMSHFFAVLEDRGPEAVSSWTAKKNVDIFEKRFIFIPINKNLHWSLCVVINPGFIENEYRAEEDQSDDQDFPCILFLDSLRANGMGEVANKIREWLNYEAKRLGKFKDTFEFHQHPFNEDTMEALCPEVPRQATLSDCGLYICRFAYSLYSSRDKQVTYETAGVNVDEPPYFRDFITNSPEFNFGTGDIRRLRQEMRELIQNLSLGYLAAKAKERAEKKRAEKKRKIT